MRRYHALFLFTVLGALAVACGSKSDDNPSGEGPGDGGPGDPKDPAVNNPTPGEKFDLKGTDFGLPVAGSRMSGLYDTLDQGPFTTSRGLAGDEYWGVRDMNGDNFPDLVVSTVIKQVLGETDPDGNVLDEVFDYNASTPNWHVYFGHGDHFDKEPTKWAVPLGGRHGRGLNRFSTQSSNAAADPDVRMKNSEGRLIKQGDLAWVFRDMDGDGKPDLVVTGAAEELVQVGYLFRVYGADSASPYWKVYRNNGTGFDKEPINWPVPKTPTWDTFAGLAVASSGLATKYKTLLWDMRDMNGDKRPDIVAYSKVEEVDGGQFYRARPAGQPNSPHWDVYLNEGNGFAKTPTPWALPRQRGRGDDGLCGIAGSATQDSNDGDNTWTLLDITGDRKPDLVITAAQVSETMKSWGYPSSSHWEVYVNTGTSFDTTMMQWPLPRGGTGAGGFQSIAYSGASVPGDAVWNTYDIDGDAKPDLIWTGEFRSGATPAIFNLGRQGDAPHWTVYRNTGTGFETENQGKTWVLPTPGGLRDHGFIYTWSYYRDGRRIGDENWDLFDLTGDGQPELVKLSDVIEDPRNAGSGITLPQVQGFGGSPHWVVFKNVP